MRYLHDIACWQVDGIQSRKNSNQHYWEAGSQEPFFVWIYCNVLFVMLTVVELAVCAIFEFICLHCSHLWWLTRLTSCKLCNMWQEAKEHELLLPKSPFCMFAAMKTYHLDSFSEWKHMSCCFRSFASSRLFSGTSAVGILFGLHGFYGKTSDLTKPKQWLCQIVAVLCLSAPTRNKEAGNRQQRKARGQRGDDKTAHLTN